MALESSTCVDCGEAHQSRTPLDPTPFHSLIDEGIPDAVEKAAIHGFLRDTNAEIVLREEEIVSKEEAIHRLRCEIVELRRRSEQHKAILAPIRRIPAEILAEIFCALTAIEAKTPGHSYPYDFVEGASFFAEADKVRPGLHKAPLVLCHVSRRWRAIALSTPRLWNSIFLECTDEQIRSGISLCDMWLKRSGSLPLSIRFYRPRSPDAQQVVDDFRDLLKTILPYAARWQLLDLENVPIASHDVPDWRLPESFPALETLSVRYGFQTIPSSMPWTGIRNAPKLRLLHLHDVSVDTSTGEWSTFPWSQLTHIDVGRCSTYDCLQILGNASTALACRFLIERSSPVQHDPISHSTLQALRLQFYVHDDVRLDLTCPRLSTLAIWMANPEDTPHLAAFTARSGATIENFELEGSNLDDTQFMACLANMPRLRNLKIEELPIDGVPPQFTDQVLDSLTWLPSASPLVPDLESLYLDGGSALSQEAIIRMLKSRVRPPDNVVDFVPKLKRITLTICRNLSRPAVRCINGFAKFGLDITLDVFEQGDETGSEASGGEESDEVEEEEGAGT